MSAAGAGRVRVDQIVVGASPGDAITNEALALRDRLRRDGPSELFALHIHPALSAEVRRLETYREAPPTERAVLVVHGSIGDSQLHDLLVRHRRRFILRYHNITPPEHFAEWDPEFARLLEDGRRELAAIRDRVQVALCDSTFNAEDLASLGYHGSEVIPVVAALRALLTATPRDPAAFPMPDGDERPVLLFVGRVAPNKRHEALLAAFHVLSTYLRPDARLCIAGIRLAGRYADTLDAFARGLVLRDCVFAGSVSDQELAALYRRADVFVCLSRHEGFCVPLVEAMAMGVPIVALDAGAVAETLGGAGLLLETDRPTIVAEAVHHLLGDGDLRGQLSALGRRRAAELDPERVLELLAGRVCAAAS